MKIETYYRVFFTRSKYYESSGNEYVVFGCPIDIEFATEEDAFNHVISNELYGADEFTILKMHYFNPWE